mmetsp:Transcript_33022/g.101953  ORF Transcript_33022/g.101953 Transcript_33022/m.101953 type:complete len:226 (-) Transcript_33022:140-817(-)
MASRTSARAAEISSKRSRSGTPAPFGAGRPLSNPRRNGRDSSNAQNVTIVSASAERTVSALTCSAARDGICDRSTGLPLRCTATPAARRQSFDEPASARSMAAVRAAAARALYNSTSNWVNVGTYRGTTTDSRLDTASTTQLRATHGGADDTAGNRTMTSTSHGAASAMRIRRDAMAASIRELGSPCSVVVVIRCRVDSDSPVASRMKVHTEGAPSPRWRDSSVK